MTEFIAGTIISRPETLPAEPVALSGPLYHYTSISGMQGIVEDCAVRASHYAYVNDYSEVRYGLGLMRSYVESQISKYMQGSRAVMLPQLLNWLQHDFVLDHNLFVCCFSENGNQLSQWRSYTPPNKGICLQFDHARLVELMSLQHFDFCRCEYDVKKQLGNVTTIVDAVVRGAEFAGPALESAASPNQSYYPAFRQFTDRVLRIAIGLKHPAFSEEAEWRFISPKLDGENLRRQVQFREGISSLVPYIPFKLKIGEHDQWPITNVTVGPTQYVNASMSAITTFLAASNITGVSIRNCQIPFRSG